MKKAITVAAVLLAMAAGPALAQRNDRRDDDRAGRNLQGFYLGGGVGDFSSAVDEINNLDDIDDVGIDFSDGDNATKVFAGWNFNRFFAVQGDFVDFGESSVSSRRRPGARRTCKVWPRASSARCRSGPSSCSVASGSCSMTSI